MERLRRRPPPGSVLIEGVKYYANNPKMIGKTFLRLERDFDKHVRYCRDAPLGQEFLAANDAVRDFFMVSRENLLGKLWFELRELS